MTIVDTVKKEFEKLVGKLKELKDIPFADWYEHGILNTKEIKNARQLINVSLDFLIKESEELQSSILKQVEKLEKEVFDLEEVVIDKESQIDNLKRGVREIFRDIENMENVFNTGEGQKEYKQIKKKYGVKK